VVDHQRGAFVVRYAPADLDGRGVGAPFEDSACVRRTQCRWQQILEEGHRLRRDCEGEVSGRINLDSPFMPAAFGLYSLVDRQCVEKFIGENDRWPLWHINQ